MNLVDNLVLKENYTFVVLDAHGAIRPGGEHGLYNMDTRFLAGYEWKFDAEVALLHVDSVRCSRIHFHYADFPDNYQRMSVQRSLALVADGMQDELTFENTSLGEVSLTLSLAVECDFVDMFVARDRHTGRQSRFAERSLESDRSIVYRYRASDSLDFATSLRWSGTVEAQYGGAAGPPIRATVRLAPGERQSLTVYTTIFNPLDAPREPIRYEQWRESAPVLGKGDIERYAFDRQVLNRAVDDLRSLLLFTEDGPIPAAGIPWFVAAFGRDALITCLFTSGAWPEVSEGTLRYLGRHQSVDHDTYRGASPGKILHELRFGELSRTGSVPFGPYYGSIDATPLYIVLTGALIERLDCSDLAIELADTWRLAIEWLERYGDIDGDGLLEYVGSAAGDGQGLPIQSWKDSNDSMSHADGTLAEGAIAPVEAQGYYYAALVTGARLERLCGNEARAAVLERRSIEVGRRFEDRFWIDRLGTYAMALDGEKRRLEVKSSNVGHLLWSGIVPSDKAGKVRDTLFGPDLWTGWGFRTLGASEVRYNPLSYHNGSVWPHDTAIAALGLAGYGFHSEARLVRNALYDLAAHQRDLRLPELVAGYDRSEDCGPVPYPVACRPQAWDAAALVALATIGE
ncbi:MAG: glycogen debranching N-terminal domain-containing protein [Spirochaetales bacterium]